MGLCPIIMVAAMAWRRSFRPDQLFQSYSTFGAPPLYLSIRRPSAVGRLGLILDPYRLIDAQTTVRCLEQTHNLMPINRNFHA